MGKVFYKKDTCICITDSPCCTPENNTTLFINYNLYVGLPGDSDGKESACNPGDPGLIPGSGISAGGGNGNPFQCFCMENAVDRGGWWATVSWVAELDMIE